MSFDFAPLANPDRVLWGVIAEVMTPPPPADYTAWAVANVEFGDESPFPGPYNPDKFPYFRRILEVLSSEHPARSVTLQGSAQIGKSVLCQIFIGATLALDPCQAIYYHPTEANATEWARLKWKPFLRGTTALQGVFGAERARDGGQSLLYYERRDGRGSLTVAGANSGPAVSMKSARIQIQDDLSKWEMLPSGDSETQADSRSKAFRFAKILKASTALVEPGCRITRNFRAGTQEHYHVPCKSCGACQPLLWENMLSTLDPDHPDAAHFTCVACDAAMAFADLDWMNANGRWEAHNPSAREPSFILWSAYSPLETWASIAHAWLKAEGDPAAEQVFMNDVAGLPYKAAGESPPFEEIRDRTKESGHRLGTIPWGGLIFTAGCDCQKDRVEVHFKAFGREGRRWSVEYRVLDGHISETATQAKLDALLAETWPDDYGNKRRLDMLAIDGNAWTTDVLAWARRHSWFKVIVTRGANSDTAAPLTPVQSERKLDGRTKRQQRRFFNLGVSGLKATLYASLGKKDPLERGYCGYPQGFDDDFYQQLCAERREARRTRDGFTVYRWTKAPSQRNEVLDTELIAEGAAIRCGWRALTDKTADDRERGLIASGAANAAAGQSDLFDPNRPAVAAKPTAPPAPAEVRAQESLKTAPAAAARSAAPRRVIRSGFMGN